MRIIGEHPQVKLPSLAIVLAVSGYWMFGTPPEAAPPLWLLSVMAWTGLGFLALVLIPANIIRLKPSSAWQIRLLPLARRRRTFGLMAALWFWGHFNLAVKFVQATAGTRATIQAHHDHVFENGQVALSIFLILFATSYRWARRLLKSDWKRLHSLVWYVVPLILVHSISAKMTFEHRLTTVSLAILVMIIGFAIVEAGILIKHRHADRWRHALMLTTGLTVALMIRFVFR